VAAAALGDELATYRVVFDDEDGERFAETQIERPDDDAAIEFATSHSHPYGMELWEDDRFVARLAPRGDPGQEGGSRVRRTRCER
jgi:hypothetical protein